MKIIDVASCLLGRGWLWGNAQTSREIVSLGVVNSKEDDLKPVSVKLPPEAVLDLKRFNSFLSKYLFSTVPYTNYKVRIFSNHSRLSKHEQCIEGDLRSIDKLSFEKGSKYPTLRLNLLIDGFPAQVPYFVGPQSELPDLLSIKQIKRIELVEQQYTVFFPEDKEYLALNVNTLANREAAYIYRNSL